MVRVVLYTIISDGHTMEQWVSSSDKRYLKGFQQKLLKMIGNEKANTIRTVLMGGLWVYYFHQESFLFVLASESSQRSARMQNYLRILTQIFYQNYDQRTFPTILDRIITEINRIQGNEGSSSAEQYEGLIVGTDLRQQKERFSQLVERRARRSKRAWLIIFLLIGCIVGLLLAFFWKRHGKAASL